MFGGFDLNLDLNKTFSDLTATLPSITLNDILEAGGDSSADASTTLFFNPTVDAPPSNAADIDEQDLDYFKNLGRKKNDDEKVTKPKKANSKKIQSFNEEQPVISSTGNSASAVSGEVTMLREQLRGREQDVSILQQRLKEKDDTLQAEKAKVKDLRGLISTAEKNEKATATRLELFQQQSNRQIADLEEKIEELRSLTEEQRTQISLYEEKLSSVDLSKQTITESIPTETTAVPLETSQQNVAEVDNAKISKLEQNLSKAKARIDKFNKKIESMTVSLREAEDKCKAVEQSAKLSQEGFLAEKVEWESKLEAKDYQINALETQIADNLKSIEELQKVQVSVIENNSVLVANTSVLEKSLLDAKEEHAQEIENLQSTNHQLEESIKEYSHATRLMSDKLSLLTKKQEEAKAALEEARENSSKLEQTGKSLDSSLKTANDSLKDTTKKLTESKAEIEQLKNTLSQKEKAIKDNEGQLRTLNDKVKEINQKYIDSKAEVDALKYQSAQKDKHIEESEANFKALSEKMRDIKQRFTDTKAENYNLEKNAETKIIELNAMLISKDSDITSLRSKIENLDRSLHDSRAEAIGLTDKLSEHQQIVARLTETTRELQQNVEFLSSELKTTREQYRAALAENEQLLANIHVTAHTKDELVDIHREQVEAMRMQYEQKLASAQARISALELEISNYDSKLRIESDSADVLENYKKRAQLALKKANTSNATLIAENAKLKADLDSATSQLNELSSTMAASVEQHQQRLAQWETQYKSMHDKYEAELEKAKSAAATIQPIAADNRSSRSDHSPPPPPPPEPLVQVPSSPATSELQPLYSDAAPQTVKSTDSVDQETYATKESLPTDTWKESSASAMNSPASNLSALQVSKSWAILTVEAAASERNAEISRTPDSIEREYVNVQMDRDTESSRPGMEESVGGKSMLGTAIQLKLEATMKELSLRGIELEASQQELVAERAERKKTQSRVEELLAFLERSKKLQGEGPDSAVNMEYLKNCVCRFMASSYSDLSEKQRLYPVISTILKLTAAERKQVELALTAAVQEQSLEINSTLNSISSTFENLWGWGTTANPGSS
eukprot:gene30757-40051_t